MSVFPQQQLPASKKDKAWKHANIDFFISEGSFNSSDNTNIQKLYEAYNGQIDSGEYNYVTDPYGRKNIPGAKPWNYPAKIRNFNILKPVVDLLMGEKSKRYMNFQVVARNSDVVSRQEQAISDGLKKNLEQIFINELNKLGVPTGVESTEAPSPPDVAKNISDNYLDERAIMGQEAIDYIKDYNEIPEHHQTCFFDWLVAGRCYTYKSVQAEEVLYETVSPKELAHDTSVGLEFVEDGSWAVRRKLMSVSAFIDRFYDVLKPNVLKELDGSEVRNSSGFFQFTDPTSKVTGSNMGRMIEVYHVQWKTLTKRGELTYIDEVGQLQKMWVDEDYKVDEASGESIKWYWLNEVMEGYKADKHYIGIGPVEIQRNEINNKSKCKLSYNGRLYANRHADNISVLMLGYQYQLLYNIYHYRFELTMAKSKDKIILMEYNAIPKKHGWDEDKFMYHADAMGFMFVDTVKDGKNSIGGFNQFQVLDASLGQYAAATMDVLRGLKQEWEELVGFNAPRKGQTQASDGLGKTQQSIFQSSVITEELFRRFEKFQEREYQGCLDVSKYAWRTGKKSTYITSDQRQLLLDIDPVAYQEAEYGIRAMNSGDENDKLNQLKQFAQAFAQNGSQPSTVAEILNANSFAKVKVLMKKAEAEQQRIQQEQQQAEQQSQAAMQQAQAEAQQAQQEWVSSDKALDRQNEYNMTALEVEAKLTIASGMGTPEDQTVELETLNLKRESIMAEIQKTRDELAVQVKHHAEVINQKEKDRELKREDIASRERIASKKKSQ